ncbi:hypothetical protein IID22_01695, partial [Patescibacteria group bacterium]|nr:hypothetical protein [Patescibacteria group bacterium]
MPDDNSPNPSIQNPTIAPDGQPANLGSSPSPPVGNLPQEPETPITAKPTSSSATPSESVVTTGGSKERGGSKSKRIVATILGIALLVAAVGAGVFLVGQQ